MVYVVNGVLASGVDMVLKKCELCGNDAHYGCDCPPRVPLVYEHEPGYDNYYPQNSPSFPQQSLNCEKYGGPHEDYQCQPWHQNYSELNPCYDSNSYGFDQPPRYSIDHQPQSIQEDLNQQMMNDVLNKWDDMIESKNELFTIPLNEIISQIPPSNAITPVLPTMEPEDSLSMGDEHLSTNPEKKSDEFIKSSVEDLIPIPSESEDTPGSDNECNDFSPINIPEGKSVTFSNPLFDSNDDFTSSDDESLSDEDVPEDNVKIYSNPLFEFDDEYISSDENPLFDDVLENIESKESYVSNLDEPAFLVTPLSDANEDECFDPGGEIDKIDDFLDMDISTDIENGYHNSEGDIIYLESLLIKDTIPNLPPMCF
ncbi:hypothetical protein Tco_0012756 [Tanacetum coccineum]